jgi:competence protein ComEC
MESPRAAEKLTRVRLVDRDFSDQEGCGSSGTRRGGVLSGAVGRVGRVAAFGTGPLLLASLGLIVIGLLRTPLRYTGGLLLAASVLWVITTPQPDILIAADGRHVGVRGADGKLRVLQDGKDAFLLKEWLAADADARAASDPTLSNGVSCDEGACVAPLADGRLVSLARWPEAVMEDCEKAAVLITRRPVPEDCAARTIDAETLRREGAQILRRNAGKWVAAAVRPAGRDRPWWPNARATADGSAPELDTASEAVQTRIPPRPAQPPRDATPPADIEPEPD